MNKLDLYSNPSLDKLRSIQDPLADQAVINLIKFPENISLINQWAEIPEFYPPNFDGELLLFFDFYKNTSLNVPFKIIQKGQEFFEKKGDLYLAMLGFYSLPYCYAFADGAQVLVRSKRILDSIGERLGETGLFIMEIFKPGAFLSSKDAFLVCAKVRLIHAFSRYFVEKYANDWNPSFGKPINQEDMIGTNLAFSLIVLRGWRKLGFKVTSEESDLVLNYWKWIGTLMGIETQYWPDTSKEAFELEKSIRTRHLKKSQAGISLINALKNYYQKNIPDTLLAAQTESLLFFFLGKEASQALDLKPDFKISGDLLGLIFRLSGLKNQGKSSGHKGFAKQLKENQIAQFGKELQINLPLLNRS